MENKVFFTFQEAKVNSDLKVKKEIYKRLENI